MTIEDDSALPLSHIRVIDMTRVRAGPTATRQFADWGADVIVVEPTSNLNDIVGARYASDFQNLGRNKRSIAINLKDEAGRSLLYRLVETADVFIENFRPDVKERLRFSYDTLKEINPRLVYVSISGFGQTGPYANRPGLDQVAQGMGGMMSVTGLTDIPTRAGIAVADTGAGLYAAIGAMTALVERERTGRGRWVKTSLLQSQIAMMDFQAARWLMDGEVPARTGNDHPTAVPMGLFRTSDGYVNVAASGSVIFRRFCTAADCEYLLADPRFCDEKRRQNRDALSAEIAKVIQRKTSAEWVALLNDAGVPCGPVYKMDEVFADPQVKEIGMAKSVEHEKLGEISLVGQPLEFDGVDFEIRAAAPDCGAHTSEILHELGVTDAEAKDLRSKNIIG